MEFKYLLPYLGVSVIIYFVGKLLENWLEGLEEKHGQAWYLFPIAAISFVSMLVSLPVGAIMYILDWSTMNKRNRELLKNSTESESKGKRIGYKLGKCDGYMEGFRAGYLCGHSHGKAGNDCTEGEVDSFAESGAHLQQMLNPDWLRIPSKHSKSYEFYDDSF